jgi:hypothetical protein
MTNAGTPSLAHRILQRLGVQPEFAAYFSGHLLGLTRWIGSWTALWLLQWWLFPHWLIADAAAVSTLLQGLPGAVIALVTVIIASVVAIAFQASSLYGARAVLMLVLDPPVTALVIRGVVLTFATLLAAASLPTNNEPSAATASFLTTLSLAVGGLVFRALWGLFAGLGRFTAPRAFAQVASRDLYGLMRAGGLGLVVFRVPMLGDMLRSGLRRGDSTTVRAALEALDEFQQDYYRALAENPTISGFRVPEGRRDYWAAEDLNAALVDGTEEAMRCSAPEADFDQIGAVHEDCARRAVERSSTSRDALIFIEGLTRLALTIHQVNATTVNLNPKPALALAKLEALAEQTGKTDVAAKALVAWGLTVAYSITRFETIHPQLYTSVHAFGLAPPIQEALREFDNINFRVRWGNKLPNDGLEVAAMHIASIDALLRGEPPRPIEAENPPVPP